MRSNELNRIVSYSNPHLFTLDLRSHIKRESYSHVLGSTAEFGLTQTDVQDLKTQLGRS